MLNTLLVESFKLLIADIQADRIYEPAPGNGHPPVRILGHLAICAELGQKYSGGEITHPEWIQVFEPGSSNKIEDTGNYSREEFAGIIIEGYPALAEMARHADEATLAGPHGVALLETPPVETSGDLVSHLLTSHLSFHSFHSFPLAQRSGWRRAAGHAPLF